MMDTCPHCGVSGLARIWWYPGKQIFWRARLLPGLGGDEHWRHTVTIPAVAGALVVAYRHGTPELEDPVCG